ncbi:hypothetical protein PTSG_13005 [Salpingoeca rosetta]|uniref:EGF-like domain-containing protein n=1 Tax=Salpingoeca rosetta (strain ATCC 50818 / BSB-021) TaxID=946362 RepID=F2UQJ4_SALR5|nr:uncharacterized protein PTSG_13005 [Salpingoeca rosetta]EGD79899.1 hypothetical protein PTSG_13005 [Salpingoeca rosetta]|eukprot:XP_004988520.1 hypothetical protein PTSG_13005 [Salpingoeca rosetta]
MHAMMPSLSTTPVITSILTPLQLPMTGAGWQTSTFEDSVVYSCHSGNVVYDTTFGSTLTTLLPPDSTSAYMTSFTRTCRADQTYTNTELACHDVNECDPDAYAAYTAATGNSAQQEQSFSTACQDACTNTIGSFECSCPAGFELQADGRSCDVLSCGLPPSRPFATVASQDQPRTYQQQALYTCDDGYTTTGDAQATATYTATCTVTGNYTFQGTCVEVDECAAQPCMNGGVCTDLVNAFECACVGEWGGPTCSDDTNRPPERISLSTTRVPENTFSLPLVTVTVEDPDTHQSHTLQVLSSTPRACLRCVELSCTRPYAHQRLPMQLIASSTPMPHSHLHVLLSDYAPTLALRFSMVHASFVP